MSLFFRLLPHPPDDKGPALLAAISAHNAGAPTADTFTVNAADFARIPGSPLAYWAGEEVIKLFDNLKVGDRYEPKQGLATADDFRFIRLWWEVTPQMGDNDEKDSDGREGWPDFAKGGEYSPYYADLHLLVDWRHSGKDIKDHICKQYPYLKGKWEWVVKNTEYYFRPGLTWPLRTNGFSVRALPAGGIFGHKGPAAFVPGDDHETLLSLAAVMNSAVFGYLVSLQLARTELAQSYEVGLIRNTPLPTIDKASQQTLAALARRAHDLQRQNYTHDETSHVFGLPALLAHRSAPTLAAAAAQHAAAAAARAAELAAIQTEIDAVVAGLYGVENDKLRVTSDELREESDELRAEDEEDNDTPPEVASSIVNRKSEIANPSLVADLLMYCVGVAFGRWDARYALDPAALPPLPGPFAPLPRQAPGANTRYEIRNTSEEGASEPVTRHASLIALVDDPGHPADIVTQVRHVLDALYDDRAEAVEREACGALGVGELRDYFRDPRRFFAHHIRRYSKSRRKAPLYWLLQSARRAYSVWLYYPRIAQFTYLTVARDVVDGKVRREESALADLQAGLAGTEGAARRRREEAAERQAAVVAELDAFRRVLDRVGAANLHPDPNDGVLLSIAPLHELVPWKEAAAAHKALRAGQYPWSSMGRRMK